MMDVVQIVSYNQDIIVLEYLQFVLQLSSTFVGMENQTQENNVMTIIKMEVMDVLFLVQYKMDTLVQLLI